MRLMIIKRNPMRKIQIVAQIYTSFVFVAHHLFFRRPHSSRYCLLIQNRLLTRFDFHRRIPIAVPNRQIEIPLSISSDNSEIWLQAASFTICQISLGQLLHLFHVNADWNYQVSTAYEFVLIWKCLICSLGVICT